MQRQLSSRSHGGQRTRVAIALVALLLASVLATAPASAFVGDRYELVVQDGQYRFVIDSVEQSRAWAGHCSDDDLGATPRPVSWNDIKDSSQSTTPDCAELARRLSSNLGNETPAQEAPVSGDGTTPECSDRASDPDGDGYGWEDNATCLAPPPPPPATVITSTVKDGVLVRWTGIIWAAGYNVYRDGEYIATVMGDTEYRDTVDAGTYEYSISSFGPGGLAESTTRRLNRAPGVALRSAIVSLGDSFISGEGGRWSGNAPDFPSGLTYDAGTNVFGVGANLCHRSPGAPIHSAAIAGVAAFNIACSGAVGADVLTDRKWGEDPQIDQLRARAQQNHLDMVVISIGGNDMGFTELVTGCVVNFLSPFGSRCQPDVQSQYESNIDNKMVPAMTAVVEEVQATLIELRQPEARIVLVSYPSGVPYAPRWDDYITKSTHGCPFYESDMRWVNGDLVPKIDALYEQVANDLGVTFLSLSDAFDGKETCSPGVTASDNADGDEARLEWTVGIDPSEFGDNERMPESVHPNALGQRALGRCLNMVWNTSNSYNKCYNNGGLPEDMRLVGRR